MCVYIYINICIYIQERRAGQLELQHKKEKKAARETPQEKYLREDLISLSASQPKTHNRLHQALPASLANCFFKSHSHLLPSSYNLFYFFHLLFQLGRLYFILYFLFPLLFFSSQSESTFILSLELWLTSNF